MKKSDFQIQFVKLSEIKPYKKNPRLNEKAVQYVKNSIEEFGFKNPVILDSKNIIVCGHTRYKAAQELGLKEIPCIIANDLTKEQIKAFRLVDNRTNEIAEWNLEMLSDELDGLKKFFNMNDFGFNFENEIDWHNINENDYADFFFN